MCACFGRRGGEGGLAQRSDVEVSTLIYEDFRNLKCQHILTLEHGTALLGILSVMSRPS